MYFLCSFSLHLQKYFLNLDDFIATGGVGDAQQLGDMQTLPITADPVLQQELSALGPVLGEPSVNPMLDSVVPDQLHDYPDFEFNLTDDILDLLR